MINTKKLHVYAHSCMIIIKINALALTHTYICPSLESYVCEYMYMRTLQYQVWQTVLKWLIRQK